MSEFTFSKGFGDGIYNEALGEAYRLAEPLHALCQSPIEIQFGTAYLFLTKMIGFPSRIIASLDDEYPNYALFPQAGLAPYRVDFYVALRNVKAVVECDGREFHYANREQIERDRARDRDLEARGLKVFRFPGAELHADPIKCAGDVMLWLLGQWCDQNPGAKL